MPIYVIARIGNLPEKILMLGLGVTCFIEFIQLFIGRSTDIDDVILDKIGVIIGYGIFSLLIVLRDSNHK